MLYFNPDPDGKTSKELACQLLETNAWTGEAIQKKKDTTDVSVLSSVTALKDDEGNFVGVVAVNRDITERKREEEELRKSEDRFRVLIENLNSGVSLVDEFGKFTIYNPAFLRMFGLFGSVQQAKRESEAINEELRIEIEEHKKTEDALVKAKDVAETAVRAKSDFMANMSHEICTPMNAVIGMTSILLDDGNLVQQFLINISILRRPYRQQSLPPFYPFCTSI